MSQTTAGEIISGGSAEQDSATAILQAVTSLNEAVSALQGVATQMADALAKLTNHSRVMADGVDPGHFSMGTGFEYDPETGRHNVTGTADFEEALRSMTWKGPAASEATGTTE